MREGPLAALFRKTEELEGGDREDDREDDREQPEKAGSDAQSERPDAAGESRERGAPHPALRAPDEEAPHVPTPRERLRHAFSSELPEDMLERGSAPTAPRRTPAADALAAAATRHEPARSAPYYLAPPARGFLPLPLRPPIRPPRSPTTCGPAWPTPA